jgi:hypothetical protein
MEQTLFSPAGVKAAREGLGSHHQNRAMNAGTAAEATITYQGSIKSPSGNSLQPAINKTTNSPKSTMDRQI